MKEMIYSTGSKNEILSTGYCFGLLYFILNLGTHPTAYIKIPKNHKFHGKDIDEIDIDVHGGITYAKDYVYAGNNEKIEGWFVGWDYAHYGDYGGYEELVPKQYRVGGKRWTTKEIYEQVRHACYQIQKEGIKNGN